MKINHTIPERTFGKLDLEMMDLFLSRASAVVPMREIAENPKLPSTVIGMRHDVDHDIHNAVRLARWEAERGYRSTYFVLHSAWYWPYNPILYPALAEIAELGHEIGYHNNALVVALKLDLNPFDIVRGNLETLRSLGYDVVGTAAHGDKLNRHINVINDEIFSECVRDGREDVRASYQDVTLHFAKRPLSDFGLTYESDLLPKGRYLSDSGGHWNTHPSSVDLSPLDGRVHVLWHPCWWDLKGKK